MTSQPRSRHPRPSRTPHFARAAGAAALSAVLAAAVTSCGSDGTGDDSDKPIVLGTMDSVTSLDPAGAYDRPSSTLFANVYSTLLAIPPNSSTPEPEAAKSCTFTDTKTFKCTLRSGLKFTNGHSLTATDVKFSFDRMMKINASQGPAGTISDLKKTEAPNARTVVFHLSAPDATFPSKIATDAGYIVDHRTYPAGKLMTDPSGVVGSGPYKLASYNKHEAKFVKNADYEGTFKLKNSAVSIHYFSSSQKDEMKKQLLNGKIDAIDRGLAPADIDSYRKLDAKGKIKLLEGTGAEIRYVVFNTKMAPFDKPDVRRAIAELVDPAALTTAVHGTGASPLYSLIPQGIAGHSTPWHDAYPQPDKAKAESLLKDAGVTTPIPVKLWYTPTHYGSTSKAECEQVKKQLEATGLFHVTLKHAEWQSYIAHATSGKYPMYAMGWFADYPDADNYTLPFFGKDATIGNGFKNKKIDDDLVPETQRQTDRAKAASTYEQIQKIASQEVPELPLWQGKQYAVSGTGLDGLQWALDGTMPLRLWGLKRGIA